jgi:hypothetical protein
MRPKPGRLYGHLKSANQNAKRPLWGQSFGVVKTNGIYGVLKVDTGDQSLMLSSRIVRALQ